MSMLPASACAAGTPAGGRAYIFGQDGMPAYRGHLHDHTVYVACPVRHRIDVDDGHGEQVPGKSMPSSKWLIICAVKSSWAHSAIGPATAAAAQASPACQHR